MSACAQNQEATRKSCERCRLQKLRCMRDQPDTSKCQRCARLGAVCEFSLLLRPGRPPKDGVSRKRRRARKTVLDTTQNEDTAVLPGQLRSEERRVGKECRS